MSADPTLTDDEREAAIVLVARANHDCVAHPDYVSYTEASCCGTPQPAMSDGRWHHEMGHERGLRGVCWACEPGAAAAVDALIAAGWVGPSTVADRVGAALAPVEALANAAPGDAPAGGAM